MTEAILLEPDPTLAPLGTGHPSDQLRPSEHDRSMLGHDFEQGTADAAFADIVAGLELDTTAEDNGETSTVLSLVADAWHQTQELPFEQAIKAREWLLDTTLRAVGKKSSYVHLSRLSEYLPDDHEIRAFGELFSRYSQNQMSHNFEVGVSGIATEFRFDKKFPNQEEQELEYCVVPTNDRTSLSSLINGSGAIVELPNGKRGIIINEESYSRAFNEGSKGARGFIAHELGHTRRKLVVGDGPRPLGHMLSELYAEWCGDDEGGYYDEKHMSNFLAATGFDIRKQYLPKIASGELSTADLIRDLAEQFGSHNTLRILAYAPTNYPSKHQDDPSALVGDCVYYALKHGKITPEQLQANINAKYTPEVANILITNVDISRLIPSNLRPMIERRAAGSRT